jgi:hypothetical protein
MPPKKRKALRELSGEERKNIYGTNFFTGMNEAAKAASSAGGKSTNSIFAMIPPGAIFPGDPGTGRTTRIHVLWYMLDRYGPDGLD